MFVANLFDLLVEFRAKEKVKGSRKTLGDSSIIKELFRNVVQFQTSQLSRIRRESHAIRFTLTLSRHV
jgi:hypothetical protein